LPGYREKSDGRKQRFAFKKKNKAAVTYLNVNESIATNQMAGRNLGTGQETFPSVITTAVIHEIDKVLVYTQLDTQ
jgi:hypothetical protein